MTAEHGAESVGTGSNETGKQGLSGARLAVAVVGGALVAAGVRRRSAGGAALAAAGGWLLYRSVRGRGSATERAGAPPDAQTVERAVTVRASADDLYERWRDPDELDRLLAGFADVRAAGEDRQRWTVAEPLGRPVAWNARITEDSPGEALRWESEPGATVPNEWSVRFADAPGDQGTEVTLRIRFDPPGGSVGDAAMSVFGVVPEVLVGEALRRCRSLAEAGETPTLDGNPSGRGRGDRL
ncbi:SRPBCC family protein [Halostella litorea]|uniref:SRPBCC family protein n=1 Tax=Halostella litorea TaxID=2528831 RepID=UPI001091E9A4|nr:SRPBCC family protein [Halostella litorea]